MSGGQDESAKQIETSEQKIDQRLIEDEMAWRGKLIEVRNGKLSDWERRVFHTTGKDACFCWGDTMTSNLLSWLYARPIEKKWRVPTDEDAKKRPKCRVRESSTDEWKEATLVHVLSPGTAFKFSAYTTSWVSPYACCEIEDE